MIVKFEKCELKIDEIQKEGISKKNFADHEKKVIELIQSWAEKRSFFEFKTSGSTGKPKTIRIERKKIEYSCNATMQRIDPLNEFRSALLCINPEMIGGAMVVFRALTRGLDLKILTPSSDPLKQIEDLDEYYDIASVVPLQIQKATNEQIDRFKVLLVGGAAYSCDRGSSRARIYSTFGMTETVSHFALRDCFEDFFECTGDTVIGTQNNGELKVKGTITGNKWLSTNDIIESISPTKFKWVGRSDFIINSGGLKINPELIESKLSTQIDKSFLVTHIPDSRLGSRIILLIESLPTEVKINFDHLGKYEKPKSIHFMPHFFRTNSDKIDRNKTRANFISIISSE